MKAGNKRLQMTEAEQLKEIEQLIKTSQAERDRREGNYVNRKTTPYGKYEEITVHNKKKKSNYFINEKKVLSSSMSASLYAPKKQTLPEPGTKGFTNAVDELLRGYAEELRNQGKHPFTAEEMKLKSAGVPHVATEKKVDVYFEINPKPKIQYPMTKKIKNEEVDEEQYRYAEDEKFIEVGKSDGFSLQQLDSEILEAAVSTEAMYSGKHPQTSSSLLSTSKLAKNQPKDRLKHVSAVRLRKKFPRFCSNLTFTDQDLKIIQPREDRWIAKFMEICYDEATNALNGESIHGRQHYYEGMNLGSFDNFPFHVQRIIAQYFSVLEIRKRVTLEILYTLELLLQRSEFGRFKSHYQSDIIRYDSGRGQLFVKFLSEEYDVDILALFLQGRVILQNTLGKKLKDLTPARMVIPSSSSAGKTTMADSTLKLLQSSKFQQRIEQQQVINPNSQLNLSELSWYSTNSREENLFLTHLHETDNYLDTTFARSQPSLPSTSIVSRNQSSLTSVESVMINKVVPIELPVKWYYLVDITLTEAPVVGFHESLLWNLICLLVPSPPPHFQSSTRPAYFGLPNEESVQQIRQYLIQKVWDMTTNDVMKDQTNQPLTRARGLQQIPSYTLLRTLCHEWKKLSKEEKAAFSYEGLVVDSLRSLNTIYDNNCAKLKAMEQSVLAAESDVIVAKGQVVRIEKELKRYERKFQRKLAHGTEITKIANLREELHKATVHRQACEQKLEEIQMEKKKLVKTTEDLWAIVMARANKGKASKASNDSPNKTQQAKQPAGEVTDDKQAALWKNYVTFMFSKIIEKNLSKEKSMKETADQSKQTIAALNTTVLIPPTPTILSTQPLDPKEIMKSATAIEKLLIDTITRIFVRTVINDGKRKVLLKHHLNIRQHELLLLYGGEEYLRAEQERQLKRRLAEEAAQREILRRHLITIMTPTLVETMIEMGRQKAFDHLYDPYWMLDLAIHEIVGADQVKVVEYRYKRYLQSLLQRGYRRFAVPIKAKIAYSRYYLKRIRFLWKQWQAACSESHHYLVKIRRIQRTIRCFLWKCRYYHYLLHQQSVNQKAQVCYEQKLLKRRKPFLLFWYTFLTLQQRYRKTQAALKERRFLICFYTWKDKFIKLRYSKMKLSKLQLRCCIKIQSTIRQYLAKRRVHKLVAKRKLTRWIILWKAKRKVQLLRDYTRRIQDYAQQVTYQSRFNTQRTAYRLWKRSYSILFGLTKLAHCRIHYNQRHRYLQWKQFARLRTKYLTKHAIKIQSVIRMYLATCRYWQYHRWRRACVRFQSAYRKHRAMYYFAYEVYYYRRAKLVQKLFRGYSVRKNINLARIVDIHYAAANNKYERLKYYCEKFPDLIYRKDPEGNSALHSAAKNAAKRTMKLLIKHMQLNPNEVNAQGYTALHLLIMSTAVHRDEIFNYVLERGFDDDQLTLSGKSCVLLAAEYNRMIILKKLLDDGHDANLPDQSGLTPLQCACSQGNVAMVRLLLENEASVHQSGLNGTYPLHDCISGRNIEVLYELLRAGAEVNVTDPMYSQTPLMWAAQAGFGEFARTLILHHADIHHKDYQGRTVAHYAAMCNVTDVYNALREADVEFDVLDQEGNSPLHLSAYYGTPEMTRNILHGGAYPSYQNDNDGEQPSHIAAKYNQLEILQALCEYDQYIGRPNYHHQTPLGLAKFYHCQECIDFLEQHYRMVEMSDGRNAIGNIWWDKQIDEEILSGWEMQLESNGNRIYINKQTGERSDKPPSIASAALIQDLATKKNTLPLRRVIELVKEEDSAHPDEEETEEGELGSISTGTIGKDGRLQKKKNTLTKHEYYLNYQQTKAEIKVMNIEYRAATTIVKYARRKLAYMEAKRLRLLKAKFKVLRRFYRIYITVFLAGRRQYRKLQAIKIQSVIRSYLSRKRFYQYPNGLYYLYRVRKARRVLRYKLWTVYCYYRFQKELRLKIAIKHHFNYTLEDWQRILDTVRRPLRTIAIFEEYKFPNTVNLKFYRNVITGNCFFNKPKEMILYDEQEMRESRERQAHGGVTKSQLQLIIKLQAMIRGYTVRNAYRYLEKAFAICQHAKENYLQRPEKDLHLYNYAIYCLAIDQDIDRSRTVFLECLRRMQWRGPDNAFVLYSYAIFAMKAVDEELPEVLDLVKRANAAERLKYEMFAKKLENQYSLARTGMNIVTSPLVSPREETNPYALPNVASAGNAKGGSSPKRSSTGTTPFRYGRIYDLAKTGFFRYAATTYGNSFGWECYALCMFLVYQDFHASFDAFMEAFKTDPGNKQLRRNFDCMMIFFHGKDKEVREAVINQRMQYLAALDNEIEENRRRARERYLKREISARRIQRWYKDRKALRIFNRFISAVRENLRRYGTGGGGRSAEKRKRQNIY